MEFFFGVLCFFAAFSLKTKSINYFEAICSQMYTFGGFSLLLAGLLSGADDATLKESVLTIMYWTNILLFFVTFLLILFYKEDLMGMPYPRKEEEE